MWIFPYRRIAFLSPLSPEAAEAALQAALKPQEPAAVRRAAGHYRDGRFMGAAGEGRFTLVHDVRGSRDFAPRVSGALAWDAKGCRVSAGMRMQLASRMCVVYVLGLVLLAATVAGAVAKGLDVLQNAFIFGAVFIYIPARMWPEAKAAEDFLKETLQAQAPAAGPEAAGP